MAGFGEVSKSQFSYDQQLLQASDNNSCRYDLSIFFFNLTRVLRINNLRTMGFSKADLSNQNHLFPDSWDLDTSCFSAIPQSNDSTITLEDLCFSTT